MITVQKKIVPSPVTAIDVITDNSARMLIKFDSTFIHATLKQVSPLSGDPREYVWDQAALRELASALLQAANIMDEEQSGKVK